MHVCKMHPKIMLTHNHARIMQRLPCCGGTSISTSAYQYCMPIWGCYDMIYVRYHFQGEPESNMYLFLYHNKHKQLQPVLNVCNVCNCTHQNRNCSSWQRGDIPYWKNCKFLLWILFIVLSQLWLDNFLILIKSLDLLILHFFALSWQKSAK